MASIEDLYKLAGVAHGASCNICDISKGVVVKQQKHKRTTSLINIIFLLLVLAAVYCMAFQAEYIIGGFGR